MISLFSGFNIKVGSARISAVMIVPSRPLFLRPRPVPAAAGVSSRISSPLRALAAALAAVVLADSSASKA